MDFTQVLSAYRTYNPAGWVAIYRVMPTWVGILCVIVGVGLLLFGGGKMFRFVAGPAGALVGFLFTPAVAVRFGVEASVNMLSVIGAAVVGVASFVLPSVAVFIGVGIPAGLLAGAAAGANDWILGFLPGFLAVGTIAAVFTRWIGAVLAAAVGAWLLVIGMLAALHFIGIVAAVASQPWGVILAAVLFAIAGTIYQLFVRPTPEEAEKLRIERQKAKRRLQDKRALEKRWGVKTSDE